MLKSLLIVGAGSFVGGAARYLLSTLLKSTFPLGTLTVNLLGCFLIGLIYAIFQRAGAPSSSWCLLLTTGFCGGFTTFSTFSNEALNMLQAGSFIPFIAYVSLSVIGGIALAALGYKTYFFFSV